MDGSKTKQPRDDYIAHLENKIRFLENERDILAESNLLLEKELKRLRQELLRVKKPPLIVGTVTDVISERKAIIRSSNGMSFLVENLVPGIKPGDRVAMNQQSLTIVELLPVEVDHSIRGMEIIEKPDITFNDIGGLKTQIQELKEAVDLPLKHPELFEKVGIEPPKGVLLYGPPGTGKTLLAKAVANDTNATFIRVTGSELVRKYIGEGARMVRELFAMAREKAPSIVFIDELDAIGGRRIEDTTGGEREVQRVLLQLLAEMDGFSPLDNVKIIGATNRPDMLDPALLRPGRFDRLIEIPLPDYNARKEIFAIHTRKMNLKNVSVDWLAKMTEGVSGAEIKAICTEAGFFAIRKGKTWVGKKEFEQAIEKVLETEDEEIRGYA